MIRLPNGCTAEPTEIWGVRGYFVHTPRENGVQGTTIVWEDDKNVVNRVLYLVIRGIEE